ncbi:hypothetical protein AY601_2805 [Pedobacter cryoconitis]|uniref:Uncharacterized protein n=2 Tax=Pedobacter cryoconitis TaxID=188932 RepID=A0A127VEL9_9SPHI|nr:hypothetical protein AY601_2805 [Pedobacter cryoconitis]
MHLGFQYTAVFKAVFLRFRFNIYVLIGLMMLSGIVYGQSPWDILAKRSSTLGLKKGTLNFKAGALQLKLLKSSQTVAALNPGKERTFDFSPSDRLKLRSSNGLYQLGDLNLVLKTQGGEWKKYATAASRMPVRLMKSGGHILAASDLGPTLASTIPLRVRRYWEVQGGHLILRFELNNKSKQAVEIGGLGIPMIFNNILEGKTLEQTHAQNVFYDPYIGRDAGYLQVTRLSGHAPSLLVVPYGHTPFEAYNPLLDDPTPRGIAFEGFYEWTVYSKAYAEQEWKNAAQWNTPTSLILKPGETRNYGVKFIVSGTVKTIEQTLEKNQRPVAISVPGYVLPQDVDARLFLKYNRKVKTIAVEPQQALTVTASATTKNGWKSYQVQGKSWGRARLTVTYEDGLVQTINYKVIKPETEVIADYGNFLTTKQWFEQKDPIFKRSPSVISYDEDKKVQVTQDNRAWIAGLSDEGGAGGWLGAMMKELIAPNKTEIHKLQRFADSTLFGQIQVSTGPEKFGVRKSLFYYAPDSLPKGTYDSGINFKTWSAWPAREANSVGRSYNYPHVAAVHWVMYRLARNYKGLVNESDWRKYLTYAAETSLAMMRLAPYYAQFGQMEGTVFYLILKDLKAEGMLSLANALEEKMKVRALHWRSLKYPFGSEMPWDSTGQEEVYMWSSYFGFQDKAAVTMDAILAYVPIVPHWAYNGNARRYWDFLYGGKLSRIERMIHHYGSALNAIPILTDYRKHPNDFYLLRAGYGGLMGSISNITENGFAPAAFHAFPSTLRNDGLSGDYGSGFFGYAVNTASYILDHPEFGWLAFGGNLSKEGSWIHVKLTTAAKSAVFVAPAGLWITLDAGQIAEVSYQSGSGEVRLKLEPSNEYLPNALLKFQENSPLKGRYSIENAERNSRGNYVIPLVADQGTEVILKKN